MTTTSILLLCAAVFMVGFYAGQVKAAYDWQKIVDIYKDIIEEYRKSLVGTR